MEDAFIREFLIDLNATQAAIRAGYSRKTARQQASRLLTKVNIRLALKAAMDARRERVGITADSILEEFKTIGFSDVGELFRQPVDAAGKPTGPMEIKPLIDWPAELRRAIGSIKVKHYPERTDKDGNVWQLEHDIIEIKFWDKQTALRAMGEHIDLFKGRDPDDPNSRKPTHIFIVAGQRVEF